MLDILIAGEMWSRSWSLTPSSAGIAVGFDTTGGRRARRSPAGHRLP